jgi:TonB family protein
MKITIKFFVICSLSILIGSLAHGQKIRFLNWYDFPVYDTVKYSYAYIEFYQESENSRVTQVFKKDSTRIRRTVELVNQEKLNVSKNKIDYFESGKIKSIVMEDFEKGTKESKEFFESGNLKSHIKESNEAITFEKYFSEDGKEVHKPILILGGLEGGMAKWNEYLSKNLRYPLEARKVGVEGTVILFFVLETDGSMVDVTIGNPEEVNSALAEEALYVIKKFPGKWIPTSVNGEYVKTKIRIPINFKLTD